MTANQRLQLKPSFAMRIVWCFALVTFLSGCATYETASLPRKAINGPRELGEDISVQPGDYVRLTLTGGAVVSGEVIEVLEQGLVVESTGAVVPDRRTIPSSDISKVEIEKFDHSEKRVAKTTALFFVVGAVVVAVFAYSLRGLGN